MPEQVIGHVPMIVFKLPIDESLVCFHISDAYYLGISIQFIGSALSLCQGLSGGE